MKLPYIVHIQGTFWEWVWMLLVASVLSGLAGAVGKIIWQEVSNPDPPMTRQEAVELARDLLRYAEKEPQ